MADTTNETTSAPLTPIRTRPNTPSKIAIVMPIKLSKYRDRQKRQDAHYSIQGEGLQGKSHDRGAQFLWV